MVHIKREAFYGMSDTPFYMWVAYPSKKAADARLSMLAVAKTIKGIQTGIKNATRKR